MDMEAMSLRNGLGSHYLRNVLKGFIQSLSIINLAMNEEFQVNDLLVDYFVWVGSEERFDEMAIDLRIGPSQLIVNLNESCCCFAKISLMQKQVLLELPYHLGTVVISRHIHFQKPQDIFKLLSGWRRSFEDIWAVVESIMVIVLTFGLGHGRPKNGLNLPEGGDRIAIVEVFVEVVYLSLVLHHFLDGLLGIESELVGLHPVDGFDEQLILGLVCLAYKLFDEQLQVRLHVVPPNHAVSPLFPNLYLPYFLHQLLVSLNIAYILCSVGKLLVLLAHLQGLQLEGLLPLLFELSHKFIGLEQS